jgi:hypothetical protein
LAASIILSWLVVCMAILAPPAAATDPVLEVLEDTIPLAPDKDGKWATTITLQNQGTALQGITFEAVLEDSNGQPVDRLLLVTESQVPEPMCEGQNPCIAEFSLAQFEIALSESDAAAIEESLSGFLEIGVTENVATEAVPITLTPKGETEPRAFGLVPLGFATVLWLAFGLGAAAFVICCVRFVRKHPGEDLRDWKDLVFGDLGSIEWDFTKNWAATVTGLGGVAGVIYGLSILPETTKLLTKTEKVNEFTILAAVFGLGVLLAPLVGTVLTTFLPTEDNPGAARVWVYLLAGSIVVWAAMGQSFVGLVFLDEVRQGKGAYQLTAFVLQGLLLVLGISVFAYAVRKMVDTALELLRQQKQVDAVVELGKEVVRSGGLQLSIPKVYQQMLDDLRSKTETLQWVLDSLQGNRLVLGQHKRVTVADTCQAMLEKIVEYQAQPHGDEKAKALLASVASKLETLTEALINQSEKPKEVPAAIDDLYAEILKPTGERVARDGTEAERLRNEVRSRQDVARPRVPLQPAYLP